MLSCHTNDNFFLTRLLNCLVRPSHKPGQHNGAPQGNNYNPTNNPASLDMANNNIPAPPRDATPVPHGTAATAATAATQAAAAVAVSTADAVLPGGVPSPTSSSYNPAGNVVNPASSAIANPTASGDPHPGEDDIPANGDADSRERKSTSGSAEDGGGVENGDRAAKEDDRASTPAAPS